MAPRIRTDRLLFLDLEQTCDDPMPVDFRQEIIQLGVCEIDTDALSVTRRASWLIRPRNWGGITPYCTELTGIALDDVRKHGRHWHEVAATFAREFGPLNKASMGWGRDDQDIAAACEDARISSPLGDYVDLGPLFRMLFGLGHGERLPLEGAMEMLGLVWPGRQHDALVDAEATAMVWCEMARRMRSVGASAEILAKWRKP